MAIQASFPIWQDERLLHNYDRLDYYVTFNDETIFRGRAFRSPKNVPIELDINRIVGDWLENGIDPEYEGVLKQENAWGQFKVWDQTTGYLLAEYGVMFNWDQSWSGESKVLSEPVNGRMDPRMRLFWSKYNVSETSVVVEGEDIYYFDADDAVAVAWDAGRATVGIRTNYSIREIVAVCPAGVRTLTYGLNWQFEVPVNDDPDNPKTYTVQWYRNGVLLDQTVITVLVRTDYFWCTPSLSVGYPGGTLNIDIRTDYDITTLTAVPSTGLEVVSFTNRLAVVTVPENEDRTPANHTVVFYRNGEEVGRTLIAQAASLYFVTEEYKVLDNSGGNASFTIDTNYNMAQVSVVVSSGVSIVSVSQNSATYRVPANLKDTESDGYDIRYYYDGVLIGRSRIVVQSAQYGNYFTVGATSNGTVKFRGDINKSFDTFTIYVRKNGGNWTGVQVAQKTTTTIADLTAGDLLEMRCDDITKATYPLNMFLFSCNASLSGNIMSLIWNDDFAGKTEFKRSDGRLSYLFSKNSDGGTIDASRLIMPAMELPEYVYERLFYDTPITAGPAELPATSPSDFAYYQMFEQSTVSSVTKVKAVTPGEYAFDRMYASCDNLTDASGFYDPDMVLSEGCFYETFLGCNNLSVLPTFKDVQLAVRCYGNMFAGCYGITTAPALPSTKLAESCYNGMFSTCRNMTNAPVLPATVLYENCYQSMFSGCRSMLNAPQLPATELKDACYASMFKNCTSITTAPALPATILKPSCYSEMFYGCTALTSAPQLPATSAETYCYAYMFYGCTSLTTAPALPATVLASECYRNMFQNCTSLTTAPDLDAPEIAYGSYWNMFNGCSSLSAIRCLATTIISGTLSGWVTGVSASGTFTKSASATFWTTGNNGIPTGWTVIEI